MLKLTCGEKVRYVKDIRFLPGTGLYALVDNGHNDLIDEAIYNEDLKKHGLLIEPISPIIWDEYKKGIIGPP